MPAEEYRRSFSNLFFEDFGWKKRERTDVRQSVLRTAPSSMPVLSKSNT